MILLQDENIHCCAHIGGKVSEVGTYTVITGGVMSKSYLGKTCWPRYVGWLYTREVYAGPCAYIVQMCYTNKYMGFALHSRRKDRPDQDVLLLPDCLPKRLSQGHLGKVLQGCIDSVADGLVKDTLHPAHQHLQTFDHGNYLKQKLKPDVFAIFPLYREVHQSNIKRIWD